MGRNPAMTYFIDPFGCVKNQVDAENMMACLDKAGWTAASSAPEADLLIVNSCGFIESAKRESINAVLLWRRQYPEKKILLAGCLAQRYAKELGESLPEADGLLGTGDIAGIVPAAMKLMGCRPAAAQFAGEIPPGGRPLLSLPGSAYVKISEGCDNRCSFCAIPLIRGGLSSRPLRHIIDECKALLQREIKELILIGQDTGSYGMDNSPEPRMPVKPGTGAAQGLAGLMEAISRLEGNFWVRLLYIHPDHFPLPILDIMENDRRFLPYFDIPFQHGSEKILRLMNRRGDADAYLALIKTIRSRLPDAAIRSTLMTGFPGETEEDFRQLLDFQKKASLDWLGCFAYSREEGTQSWSMKGRVAKKTASDRKRLIEEAQIPITERQMDRFAGKLFDALVEEKIEASSAGEQDFYLGRLPCQAPDVDGSAVIIGEKALNPGAFVQCRVIARRGFDLEARPV